MSIESMPSRVLASIDLPEPVIDKTTSGFVYNRFEKNESLIRADTP
jgi:hypothetical protein